MYTERKKNFTVTITNGDREAARHLCPGAPLSTIDRRAVARAAARQVLVESKSTVEALNSLIDGIPRATLEAWMKWYLKEAH